MVMGDLNRCVTTCENPITFPPIGTMEHVSETPYKGIFTQDTRIKAFIQYDMLSVNQYIT